jgi:hypothetical protein
MGYGKLMGRIKGAAASRGKAVLVGIQGSEAAAPEGDSALTVAEVASFHEFGLGHSPERSWLRAWFDEHEVANTDLLRRAAAVSLVEGRMTPEQALGVLGAKLVGDIQARIASSIPPPLAPETAERKGSTVSLVDHGQLKAAVTSRVEGT